MEFSRYRAEDVLCFILVLNYSKSDDQVVICYVRFLSQSQSLTAGLNSLQITRQNVPVCFVWSVQHVHIQHSLH